jgi:iron complex transport system permease protein
LGAIVAAALANARNPDDVRSVIFWLNGDLTGRTMHDVQLAVVPICAAIITVLFFGRDLNLLLLGEAIAQSSGVNVPVVRQTLLVLAALMTAAAVSITGVISFVGLVVPHAVRLVLGSDHRLLVPASALTGAIFLLVADVGARLLLQPVVLQTGTITALIGAPVLLALILRRKRA